MSREAASIAIAPRRGIAARAPVVASAWRSLTWRHHAFVFVCSLLYAIPHAILRWSESPPEVLLWKAMLAESYQTLLIAFPLLLAIAIANQIPSKRRQWLPYAIAAVAAPTFGLAVARYTWSVNLACECPGIPFWRDFVGPYPSTVILTGFVTFGVAHHRRSQQRLAALSAAQIERAKLGRQELESRLQAMQARIEPRFLFNTLMQVEQLYDADPALAGRMLDDLIVYLRAALPLIRESTSTLGKEIDLARAYLNIVKVRLGDRLAYDIALSDDSGDVRIPPMVLLPLIDHAIVYGLESSQAGGSIRIATSIAGGRLRLAVLDSGAGFIDGGPGNDGIAAIRERLAALYGDDAQLVLRHEADVGTQAMMEIPCERARPVAPEVRMSCDRGDAVRAEGMAY